MDNRRDFLKKMTALTGALGISSVVPPAIQRAMAISPVAGSTFLDAEHVVFLMQENRSFDHCFGSLKGVRGFNDQRVLRMENEVPVWFQSNAEGKTFAPFRLNMHDTKATWMSSLPHTWTNQVDALNGGRMNGWLEAKKSGVDAYANMPLTMGYYNREDIPFYYALADAFTICDQYFCSSLTGTSPNRSYFWSGTIRENMQPDSQAMVWNDDIDHMEHLTWKTYPERLQEQGVDWKIYQNELTVGVGFSDLEDNLLANFGDNTIEYFKAFQVRLHEKHIQFLKAAQPKLEKQREKLKNSGDAKALAECEKRLNEVKRELDKIGDKTFDALSDTEKELHRRAFVTNVNDPYYHQLVEVNYTDKAEKRSMKIPKGDILHQFRTDVDTGKLPTVSWLVAPSMFSDHPGAPWFGAWYLSEVMDILTKNPEVWKKTIFILTYDENDGYFDHVAPFVAPNPEDRQTGLVSDGIKNWESEYVSMSQKQGLPHWDADTKRESPIGLGFRVPTIVASPWTRGGYVNSQVFDHTSCLQFLEYFLKHKSGKNIREENITLWRRALCGNLTSVFRPYHGENLQIPKPIEKMPFIEGIYNAKFKQEPQNFVEVPADQLNSPESLKTYLPKQEKGIKPACALPYELFANARLDASSKQFTIDFVADNQIFGDKAAGAGFRVYANKGYLNNSNVYEKQKNWSFTVKAGEQLSYDWVLSHFEQAQLDLVVMGPNGFYRSFKGDAGLESLQIKAVYERNFKGDLTGNLVLEIETGIFSKQFQLRIKDMMNGSKTALHVLKNNSKLQLVLQKAVQHTWYDVVLSSEQMPNFEYRYAGKIETGVENITDPSMAE